MRHTRRVLLFGLCGVAAAACAPDKRTIGEDSGVSDTGDGTGEFSHVYSFPSAFTDGDSVAYSGQVFRHVLINDMKSHLDGMTGRLNRGEWYPESGEATDELDFYFSFDSSTGGAVSTYVSSEPPPVQEVYDDISSGKNLVEKLAGNDPIGQHVDWLTGLAGVGATGSTNPEALVRGWFDEIDAQAVAWANGTVPLGPDGTPVTAVYITPDGRDLQQLLEKFLRGAVGFSQGADDYLDNDEPGKGLLSDHLEADEGKPYTALEHQWDEGFGYFGASRSYSTWSDDDIADLRALDDDGSGDIDLLSEYAFGHSVNAAKRDRSQGGDLTAQAFDAFYEGRSLLSRTAGQELSDAERTELYGYRDEALAAWEEAIVRTVVHYVDKTLLDAEAMDAGGYDFADHAKHWSELKGFALSMQFNPRSPLSDADFVTLHELIGDAPVLQTASGADREARVNSLNEARVLLVDTYQLEFE